MLKSYLSGFLVYLDFIVLSFRLSRFYRNIGFGDFNYVNPIINVDDNLSSISANISTPLLKGHLYF